MIYYFLYGLPVFNKISNFVEAKALRFAEDKDSMLYLKHKTLNQQKRSKQCRKELLINRKNRTKTLAEALQKLIVLSEAKPLLSQQYYFRHLTDAHTIELQIKMSER